MTGEIGPGAFLHVYMYSYTKEESFKKLAETKINNVIDVSYIEISRDGSKVAILLPEPTNSLKILDYSNTPEGSKFKEMPNEVKARKGFTKQFAQINYGYKKPANI